MKRSSPMRVGFTLIELIVVVVILAILAGVALPTYFDYQAQARESATKGALGGTRSGIANFYANQAILGSAVYPTFAELTTVGTVMQEVLPENPYTPADNNIVRDAPGTYAVPGPVLGTQGWAYDSAVGKFWANSSGVGENAW